VAPGRVRDLVDPDRRSGAAGHVPRVPRLGAASREEDVQLRQPPEQDEERVERDFTPPLMLIVPAALLLGAIAVGLTPGLVPAVEAAAARFTDHAAYAMWVVRGGAAHFAVSQSTHVETFDYLYGAAGTLGALAIAALTLFGAPLRRRLPRGLEGPPRAALTALRELHSGHIGDYIAWWTAATALLGGACLVLLT